MAVEENQSDGGQIPKSGNSRAEIQEGNAKSQLQEILQEIDLEVRKEEVGPRPHTWKPKGNYEVKKTEIQYEDIVPIAVPELTMTEKPKETKKVFPKQQQQQKVERKQNTNQEMSAEAQKVLRHTIVNGEPISPLDIPTGIPLLAKMMPKSDTEDDEPRERIPLERIFTPATDTGEILPMKKKAFASSCFYSPDHPTIDDQVELAHKISVSLVDDHNKASKGHNMYMKRKNRSSKWIHQAAENEENGIDEPKMFSDKPPLKLVLNPKGVQDYNAVQKHYEELMASSSSEANHQITRMEVGMEIANHLQSPTGKGAALFAKRKKRMDKFIVDETTVQQAPSPSTLTPETAPATNPINFNVVNQSPLINEKVPLVNVTSNQFNAGKPDLPDLCQILTRPIPPEKKKITNTSRTTASRTKTTSRSKSADSRLRNPCLPKLIGMPSNAKSSKPCFENPLINLRPGSPPTVLIPNSSGEFTEKKMKTSQTTSAVSAMNSNDVENPWSAESGAMYTAEVKLVQNSSLPTTPIDYTAGPPSYLIDQLDAVQEEDKRKSFNLAPKGWGTYADYYTPLHLEAR